LPVAGEPVHSFCEHDIETLTECVRNQRLDARPLCVFEPMVSVPTSTALAVL